MNGRHYYLRSIARLVGFPSQLANSLRMAKKFRNLLRKTRIFSVFLHRCRAKIALLPIVKWVYVPASSHFSTSFTPDRSSLILMALLWSGPWIWNYQWSMMLRE